ncbi:MAG: hypothetical protein ABIA11_00045 [Patescibacteria group bacterium]
MTFIRQTLLILLIASIGFAWADIAQAGFGISPAQIQAHQLAPGSHYEQRFILSRGQPTEDLVANISFEFPNYLEVLDWITIDPGDKILLPEGQQRVPMYVKIDVPKGAEYKTYLGSMRVGVSASEALQGQGVSISLGAKIDVSLMVTEIQIIEFKIKGFEIPPAEEGFNWWKIKLPGKVELLIDIENAGNVKAAPNRAEIEIYDLDKENLLYKGEDKSLEKIDSFDRKKIVASFKHRLEPGQYWTTFRVFKNEEELLKEDTVILTVTEMEMSTKDWLSLVGMILLIIILTGLGILKRKKIIQVIKKVCVKENK